MGGLAELQVWRKAAIKIRNSSRVIVQFLNAFELCKLGGLREAQALQAVLQDRGHQLLLLSPS